MSLTYTFRRATEPDLEAIVMLLADDEIGATREHPELTSPYRAAFARIDGDDSELLMVAVVDGVVVGTMQLSFLPGLSRGAATRLQIEGVRTATDHRSSGLGGAMMDWAIRQGEQRGCVLAQLTSDVRRTDAQRFYERLGFEPSHVGYKRRIGTPSG